MVVSSFHSGPSAHLSVVLDMVEDGAGSGERGEHAHAAVSAIAFASSCRPSQDRETEDDRPRCVRRWSPRHRAAARGVGHERVVIIIIVVAFAALTIATVDASTLTGRAPQSSSAGAAAVVISTIPAERLAATVAETTLGLAGA